jgi:hypothetical protein
VELVMALTPTDRRQSGEIADRRNTEMVEDHNVKKGDESMNSNPPATSKSAMAEIPVEDLPILRTNGLLLAVSVCKAAPIDDETCAASQRQTPNASAVART